MDEPLFDRAAIARNLSRRPPERDDFVTALVHADLGERLLTLSRRFENALAIGPAIDLLPQTGITGVAPIAFRRIESLAALGDDLPDIPGGPFDLIVSLFDISIVEDVPGYLARLGRHLVPDGLLLVAGLGGDSLAELRAASIAAEAELRGGASPRVAPFIALREAGALIQRAGLALPVADLESHRIRYAEPLTLMAELKRLGAANPLRARSRVAMTRRLLLKIAETYTRLYADPDGRVGATLEIAWLSGWRPHERQQQPLKPGSARTSLRDVLGDKS